MPDPVPQTGIDQAVELMKSGNLFRYHAKNAQSLVVSICELEIAQYTGHKYCVALNSCGSAIMLMMKCAGLMPGDEVFCNAFTFGAVPSAIEHAGGKVRILLCIVVTRSTVAFIPTSPSSPTHINIDILMQ